MAERAHPEDRGFQEGSPYRANLFKRYAFASKFTEGKAVLDIPCGVGWGTSLLKAKYKIGIDISADAIAYAKSHYQDINFSVGDMANIPLEDDSVDAVVCLEGFEHVNKETGIKFLNEAVRVVKDSGLLIMTIPVILPDGKHSDNPYHLHEPTLPELENIMAQSFCTQSMEIIKGPDCPVAYFVGSPRKKTDSYGFYHKGMDMGYHGKSKSNILLTTSVAPAEAPFSTSEKRPPVGIGFLISVLRNAGHKVFFIDNYLQPSDFLETDYLQQHSIDYVGIYANTVCFRDTLRMIKKLQQLRQQGCWNGKILVGGPHATVAPETIPACVDFVVQGEGEKAIIDIVEGRVTERIIRYPRIENLDDLPPPAWDYFAGLPYNQRMEFIDDKPVFSMNTSRGCPFSCRFCSVGSLWDRKYTYFSADRVVSDIEHLIRTYGAKGIYFREDNFTLNRRRLERFCNLIIDKGIKISWVCESRVSNLKKETISLMVKAGLKGFYFGVESGSQRMLDLMGKGTTVEQIRSVFEWCHELNVKTAASLVVGVPGETRTDLIETQKLIDEIRPNTTWVNIFVGMPYSPLYRAVVDNRLYEYIDDRGLVYLQGHNERVSRYYTDGLNAFIPNEENRKDMADKPKVSVLMGVYNAERFVEQALRSIYNQSFGDFEVVIVDDCSTDGTADILLKMKDSRTVIYRNQTNQGLTKSLNIGLRLCRGEYVARMDADDISHAERFGRQVQFLDGNPDCIAVGSWYERINEDDKVWLKRETPVSYDAIKNELLIGNCIGHGTAMIRRAELAAVGGYNETYRYSQDYDLWLRLSERGSIQNIPEYLYQLRRWGGAVSSNNNASQAYFTKRALAETMRRKGNSDSISITLLRSFFDRAMLMYAEKCFSECLEALDRLAIIQPDISKHFKNFNALREMALSALGEKELSSVYAEPEQSSSQSQAEPKVSIIVSCYDSEEFLHECLDSIRRQTFTDWEAIVIDDCSKDGTRKIIERYAQQDSRIRPYYFEDNKGAYVRLNFGIDQAKTDYIVVHDADDIMDERKVELLYNEISNDTNLGIVGSCYAVFLDEFTGMDDCDKIKLPLSHDEIAQKFTEWQHAMGHSSAITRRDLLITLGKYDENRFSSDAFFFAKAALYSKHCSSVKFKNLPFYLNYFRRHSRSMTQTLPTFCKVSKRTFFHKYCEYKLMEIRAKLEKEPNLDVASELRNCICSDFTETYKDTIKKLESLQLDDKAIIGITSWAVTCLNERNFVACICTLNSCEKLRPNMTKDYRHFDLLRGMAYLGINRKEQARQYLNSEILNHSSPAAKKFIADFLDNAPQTDILGWCRQYDSVFDLAISKIAVFEIQDMDKSMPNTGISIYGLNSQHSRTELPLVSVIMPVFNGEKYLSCAIKSVLEQDYKKFELIIINDGSTDKTEQIVLEFKDERIRYFKQANRGLAATHNEGIKKSTGSLIIKLDVDDWMTVNFISGHVDEFLRHPQADLVYCDDRLVEDNGDTIRIVKRPEYRDNKLLIRDLFSVGYPIVPFRTCIRKSVFDRIGLFDDSLRMAEDYDMMRRFVRAGMQYQHLRAPLYIRRMTKDSLSRRYTEEKIRIHFGVWRKFLEEFSYDELFPDVPWESIPQENRQMQAKCLAASIAIKIGQSYMDTNVPLYTAVAIEEARGHLHDCLRDGSSNPQIERLMDKCERLRNTLRGGCLQVT